ncbi:MAG TPA: glycosyl hydrolase 108 family protein [Gammaproteobacteria bacterium]|jgi:lysozyme family protein
MGFDEALKFTLEEEGGYVDDPRDRGGATTQGVTQTSYESWRKSHDLAVQDVRLISDSEVRDLYRERFWEAGHCAELPMPLAVAHFDWCVNRGPGGALETLQEALGVTRDGLWGPATASAAAKSAPTVYIRYDALRRQWYLKRVAEAPDQAAFLKGWLKRVGRLDTYIEGLR